MSYRGGYSYGGGGSGGGGYGKKSQTNDSNQKSFSMNAVPPPSSLSSSRPMSFQKSQQGGLSKHGYSTMDCISQFANSSQYALGKRKSKTEDE